MQDKARGEMSPELFRANQRIGAALKGLPRIGAPLIQQIQFSLLIEVLERKGILTRTEWVMDLAECLEQFAALQRATPKKTWFEKWILGR